MKNNKLKEFVFSFDKFGTKICFSLVESIERGVEVDKSFLEAKAIYDNFDSIFNRFDKKSEVSVLNSHLNSFVEASPEMIEAARKSLSYNNETEGYFDPRVLDFLEEAGYDEDFYRMSKVQEEKTNVAPELKKLLKEDLKIEDKKIFFGRKMDFSGIVKGMVNDKVVEYFISKDYKNFVVDSGGDMFFSGAMLGGKEWLVDVEGLSSEKLVLGASGMGVATSGISKRKWEKGGKRKHHLVNPKEPENFKFDLRTVTVMDFSTERADVWAKALFLMGAKKGKEISKSKGIRSIFLDYSGAAWISPDAECYKR